ncbi:MAG: hypothetical protein EOM50_20120 [Erysipelotrichia bacterium]|uniref:hypothetical protein n=1 Tax=Sulfurospirillum cavolei TaxID=366522 RepID=UPI0005AB1152|nr:hypothetical protein [Sulfurospirillum cavolei]NBL00270.1 hypothetical protein [Erysipelotrichia bacterium]
MKKLLIVVGVFFAGSLCAGDKVVISSYANYPTASGCVSKADNAKKSDCILLANGTLGEVIEWDSKYSKEGKGVFAQVDMFTLNKVSILNGPAKGKVLYIDHIYLTLKN